MAKEIQKHFFSFRQQYLQITIVNSINRRCKSIEFIESLTNPNTDWQLVAFVVEFSNFFLFASGLRICSTKFCRQHHQPFKHSFDFRLNATILFEVLVWYLAAPHHDHGHGFSCDEPTSNQQNFGQKMHQPKQWSREHAPGATANRTISAHSRRRE